MSDLIDVIVIVVVDVMPDVFPRFFGALADFYERMKKIIY
jgi:hypothetical protein